ncbi:MAG: C40 family peptidase [Pirellulales bacterium]|nr:C40 family peptidase [Pirellulales bacterium]
MHASERFVLLCLAILALVSPTSGQTAQPAEQAGVRPTEAQRRLFDRILRAEKPDLAGRPERFEQCVAVFRRELAGDPRLFAVGVTATRQPDGTVRLAGHVEFEENRRLLVAWLAHLGFEKINNQIELLPSAGLGGKRFGIVAAPHALAYDHPREPREAATDCLLGWPVYLLKETPEGQYLCHSAQGYVGYLDARAVRPMDAAAFARYMDTEHVLLQEDFDTGRVVLPLGARLTCVGREGDEVRVELPSGERLSVPKAKCAAGPPTSDERIDRVIRTAQRFLGTRYLWGGKTTEGIDCSGLAQVSFLAAGVHLARDADQQAYAGTLSATRWHRQGLRRGDALFFLGPNGRITHTAVYLGEGRYIEAVRPKVRIASFDPADECYNAAGHASFCFAKRLLE